MNLAMTSESIQRIRLSLNSRSMIVRKLSSSPSLVAARTRLEPMMVMRVLSELQSALLLLMIHNILLALLLAYVHI